MQTDRDADSAVRIVDYTPAHRLAFQRLNYAWIERYFTIEEPDRKALDDPETKILAPGGAILIALLGDEPVGTCALLRHDAATFELAKMCVDESAQGRGIGRRLGEAAIRRAHELGATELFLESNSTLVPALELYRRLGFVEVACEPTPYARCDVRMVLRRR
ncbi:MAG: GNAT family N-acetyltransferase [Planctomycetes bacterium]|nr:GNAT family N-acetyltransferase [Planctomycetota bacterium]